VPIASVITRDPSKGSKEDEAKETAKDEKLKTWVFIFKNGEVKSVEVKTGLQDIDYFEITEGLKGGEEVVAGPVRIVAKELNDGDKVKKAEKGKEDKKEEK
jgi:HlyD family secretion protein